MVEKKLSDAWNASHKTDWAGGIYNKYHHISKSKILGRINFLIRNRATPTNLEHAKQLVIMLDSIEYSTYEVELADINPPQHSLDILYDTEYEMDKFKLDFTALFDFLLTDIDGLKRYPYCVSVEQEAIFVLANYYMEELMKLVDEVFTIEC